MSSTGIALGLKKGYPVTSKPVAPRPASKKGRCGKKVKMVRELIREVAGLMPYEKRVLDMIKTGGTAAEKRIYKFTKNRVRRIHYLIFIQSLICLVFVVGNAQACFAKARRNEVLLR